jgi:hypothetical protein
MAKTSSKKAVAADAPSPPKSKPERNVDDRLGECLRELAVMEGALKGTYQALAEPAKDHWRRRSASLREIAAKRGINIEDKP